MPSIRPGWWYSATALVLCACSSGQASFSTRAYREGALLVLENDAGAHVVRLELDTRWGGAISGLSIDGVALVDRHDAGRLVQPALYDGNDRYDTCAGCTGVFGWDPVLGGDEHGHGTPVSVSRVGTDSLYVRAQPLQWNPDDKGGGAGKPVPGDVIVEQTVTPVKGVAEAFHVHYVVTHLGADLHANIQQELPATFVEAGRAHLVAYSGSAPWTHDALPPPPVPAARGSENIYTPERWAAYVDAHGVGLALYAPAADAYTTVVTLPGPGGPTGGGSSYLAPVRHFTIGPHATFEGDAYLIAGDYRRARDVVYAIHDALAIHDVLPPIASVQAPRDNSIVSGVTTVHGWAFDDSAVATVSVLVDGEVAGTARYGAPAPDVGIFYPGTPPDIGFSYALDTTRYADGAHTVVVHATDEAGNVAVLRSVSITIANGAGAKPPRPPS